MHIYIHIHTYKLNICKIKNMQHINHNRNTHLNTNTHKPHNTNKYIVSEEKV